MTAALRGALTALHGMEIDMAKKEQSLRFELGKGNQILTDIPNRKTAKQYLGHVDRFCQWLADHHGIKRRSQLVKVYGTDQAAIQAYADYLILSEYSASTIHDYLSGVCRATGVSLADIDKPKRITADNIRSRTAAGRNVRADQEVKSGKYDRLALLAVSVFHLSHWRLDVAIDNYLNAK